MTGPTPDELLAALEKLPETAAVTYRGLPADAVTPSGTFVTQAFTATSRDPRIATEDFTAAAVVAIAGRTGRDIAFLAQNADEAEVVLLPGTILRPVGSIVAGDLTVHIVEELLIDDASATGTVPPHPALPPSAEALSALVTDAVTAAREVTAPMTITSPGKFCGPLG